MAVEFDCPGCKQRLRVADEHAGKQTRCPQCQTISIVPASKPFSASNPFSVSNPFSDATADPNPYASPTATKPMQGYVQPHRGGVILALGILSWMFCPICGAVAWVMGRRDLRLIRAGAMDPQGEGMSMAGMILGMVHCVLLILTLVVSFVLCFGSAFVGGIR